MFGYANPILLIAANIGFLLIGAGFLWLLIYSAVRSALSSHRAVLSRLGRPDAGEDQTPAL
jgi:hypothetical protein